MNTHRFPWLTALALVSSVAALGCGDDGAECGAGTVEVDGTCVPAEDACADGTVFDMASGTCVAQCGEGQVLSGGMCTDALACADGTVQMGTECVPDGSVICTGNTTFVDGACVPTEGVCEDGTVFVTETGTCVPFDETLEGMADVTELAEPNDPSFDEGAMAQVVDIADGTGSFYGCIEPQDFDDDGATDIDLDFFQITVDEPTILDVRTDGIRGLSAAVAILGATDELVEAEWQRFALDLTGDGAEQKIFLPQAGDYLILASDARALLFDEPAGGMDQCYFVQLATEELPDASAIEAGTAETGTFGDPVFYELTASEAQLLFPGLSELDGDGMAADLDSISSSFVYLVNGDFRGTDATGVIPSLEDGDTVLFAVDYVFNLSLDPIDFEFLVDDSGAQQMPTDGSTVTIEHSDELFRWVYFTATAGDVVRIEFDADGDELDQLAVFGPAATGGGFGGGTASDGDGYVQITETGFHYVRFFNNDGTDGEDYTVAFTQTDITPTELTRGTAAGGALDVAPRAFFSVDVTTADWVSYGVSSLANITDAGVSFYPLGEFGTLDASLPTVDEDVTAADLPFERIYAGDGAAFLISVEDLDAVTEDETFDFLVEDVDFTDLGSVSTAMGVTRDDETAAADEAPGRYLVRAATIGEIITVSATNMAGTNLELNVLDVPGGTIDETVDDEGGAGTESFTRFVNEGEDVIAFTVVDRSGTGGMFDLEVSAEPPPYTSEASMLTFASVCPSEGGAGTALAEPAGGFDDGLFDPIDLTAGTPFPFQFFGETMTEMTISTNGWLTFEPGYAGSTFLPGDQGNVIAPFATDLVPTEVCTLRDADEYTIEFRGATFGGFGPGEPIEFQVVLNSTSGTIDVIYGPGQVATAADLEIRNADASIPLSYGGEVAADTSFTWTPAM